MSTKISPHPNKRLAAAFATCLALPGVATALDDAGLEWNGFLNITGGWLQHDARMDFTDKKQYQNYEGYEHQLTFEPQSSGGLQAKKKLDDKTSVTMQLYAEGDVDSYNARMKWLYVTYKPDFHSTIRVGRIGLPVYYFSDFLHVGYAYHWISPPEAVYPFDVTINALDYIYESQWGSWDWTYEMFAGQGDDYLPLIHSRVITRNMLGASLSVSRADWLTIRGMIARTLDTHEADTLTPDRVYEYATTTVDTALEAKHLTDLIPADMRQSLIEQTAAKVDNGFLDLKDIPVVYGDFAIRAETERWLLMTEWIKIHTQTALYSDLTSGFVSAGIHEGAALFHITLSSAKNNISKKLYGDLNAVPPDTLDIGENSEYLAAVIRTRIAGTVYRDFQSVSLGVRYELSPSTALKFDVTPYREKASFEGDTYGVSHNIMYRTALNVTF